MAARYSGNSYSHEWWPPSTTSVSVTASGPRGPRRAAGEPRRGRSTGTTPSSVPWTSRTGPRIARTAARRADRGDRVAARPQVDARRQPGERPGDRTPGSGGCASRNVWRVSRYGIGGRCDRDDRGDVRVLRRGDERPDRAHRVAEDRRSSSPRAERAARRRPARASAAYSPTVIGSFSGGFAPWPRTSKVRTWNPAAWRTWAFGSVRSRADSQPWTRTTPGRRAAGPAGMNQPGRSQPVARRDRRRPRTAARRRRASTPADAAAGSRRGRGRRARTGRRGANGSGRERGERCPRGGRDRRDGRHGTQVRHAAARERTCQAGRRALHSGRCPQRTRTTSSASSAAPAPTRSRPPGGALARGTTRTSPATTRSAARRATRRMAEINDAYAALTRAGETIEARGAVRAPPTDAAGDGAHRARRRQARVSDPGRHPARTRAAARRPPSPRRPVTGRVDMSGHVPAAQPDDHAAGRRATRCRASRRCARTARSRELPRRRQPTGPLESRPRAGHVRRSPPPLDDARMLEVDFGKFHGHTLGEIAAFEPSYIDWLAGTVTRDPDARAGGAGHPARSSTGGGSGAHRSRPARDRRAGSPNPSPRRAPDATNAPRRYAGGRTDEVR